MKRNLFAFLVLAAFSSHALAHDFWLLGDSKELTSVDIGFGHDFPNPEKIDEKRVNNFETPLKQSGENYHYERAKLDDGTYLIIGEYKPTFWTEASDGTWHMNKNKKDIKGAKFCRHATMSAKGIINLNAKDDFVTKPVHQRLEIVPLDNPANFKVGVPFKVKVLFEGKPLKEAVVNGTFEGFLKEKSAFHGETEDDGTTEVLALKPGKWMLEAVYKFAFSDPKICDEEKAKATFAFEIK